MWRTYLLRIPTSSCVIFIVVSSAILFGTSNNPMCHIFLILSYVYIFFSKSCISLNPCSSCISSITVSPAMPSTTSNTSSQTIPQQHNKTTPPKVSQRLYPAAPLLPPCCQPLPSLALHCFPLAAQCWCWPLLLNTWSVIRLQSMRHPLSKQNKIRWAFFASIGQVQFLPHQSNNSWKWLTAMVMVMANGDGNCDGQWWWRRQWLMAQATALAMAMADGNATEIAAAMVDGNCNGNGRWQWRWVMAMAMAMDLATTMEMATGSVFILR